MVLLVCIFLLLLFVVPADDPSDSQAENVSSPRSLGLWTSIEVVQEVRNGSPAEENETCDINLAGAAGICALARARADAYWQHSRPRDQPDRAIAGRRHSDPCNPGSGLRDNEGSFPVDTNGNYVGEAYPGTYTVIYRAQGMTWDKKTDKADNVEIVAGSDTRLDIDMSRKEFVDALPRIRDDSWRS